MNSEAPNTFRVLYLEDAFDQALLVKAFFNALPGYTVVHAQDGDHALQLVEQESWDMLVTDLNLPGADGFTVIRRMRARNPQVPILVTTGYTQAQYEEQALRAGADQVMIKPLSQTDFVQRVESMVGRARSVGQQEEVAEKVILAIEGRIGDAEMGCGGTLIRAVEGGTSVVIVPILGPETEYTQAELKAAAVAATVLGIELRVDQSLLGNEQAQLDLLERTINELRPTTIYLPAPDDRDEYRYRAYELGLKAGVEIRQLLGYETATTGLDFSPSHFSDVRSQMVMKMEALGAYQSVGAPRVDLRPRMAQAYARYWGRFRDFSEVEAFQEVRP